MDFLTENCAAVELQNLMGDEILSRACLKSLEIIGEASRIISEDLKEAPRIISEDLKEAHPEIPWRQMTGMRNKLVHHYFGVDWEIVDDVLKNELPDLRSNIKQISSSV
jgi:uncharacterized protein with HEPN domain